MRAMILCAGEGTRLKPLTELTPKSLLPVSGKPLVMHQIDWLSMHGICDVVINLFHLGGMIKQRLGDGSSFGVKIIYSHEDRLLGTAGAVKKVEACFQDTFIIVYGDVLTNLDLTEMIGFHHKSGGAATISLYRVSNPSECGIVSIDSNNVVKSFVEKPLASKGLGDLANGGIYILEPQVLKYIPADEFFDFGQHLFPILLEAGEDVYGYSIKPDDYIIDIGTPKKYSLAQKLEVLGAGC